MKPIRTTTLACAAALLALAACGGDSDAAKAGDEAAPAAPADAGTAPAAPAAPAAHAGEHGAQSGALLDPNSATREELMAIPGFDAALADAVVAGRPYQDMTAVDRVLSPRLAEAQRDTVYTHLFKPLDLNSATGDEILLIPRIGNKMKHEFEEYRPYRNIEQFRREIGKYVDKEEVARLERYVTIKQ